MSAVIGVVGLLMSAYQMYEQDKKQRAAQAQQAGNSID